MNELTCDVLVVGGGIIGLTVARELSQRGVRKIVLLEKEAELGMHASGRNSGVLHAGIYYGSDSLKAQFCSKGARLLYSYACDRHIPVSKVGKVIVASRVEDIPQIEILYQRCVKNHIRVEKITPGQLRQIEPLARTVEVALHSPETAIIDSKAVLKNLHAELLDSAATVLFSEPVTVMREQDREVRTPHYRISYGHLVNAAGLQADLVAQKMGVGEGYRLLPFRGVYRKLRPEWAAKIRGLIYPVPDLKLPFLGVHITPTTSGTVMVGPTAAPALGRENYKGMQGIRFTEFLRIMKDLCFMMGSNRNQLGSHVASEMKKYLPGGLLRSVRDLMPAIGESDLLAETKVGLRAQLIELRRMELVMDFVIEKGAHSTHILNAVSPAFTASMAFAELVADTALKN